MAAIRDLARRDISAAAGVIARAMQGTQLNVAALGPDPHRRVSILERMFSEALPTMWCPPLGAFAGDTLVGLAAMAPPGACALSSLQRRRLSLNLRESVPEIFVAPVSEQLAAWTSAWAARDLPERHWHLGPCAVDPPWQNQGIGKQLMAEFCARIDAARALVYLETDEQRAVKIYLRFGFEVVGEVDVLGLPTWLMARKAKE